MGLRLEEERYLADHQSLRRQVHPVEAACVPELREFASHGLEEQLEVELADRTDSKYLLPIRVLPRFLAGVNAGYSILQANGHRLFTYQNTYFDTPDRELYLHHHNGKRNRHKCRYRRYHETDISYLEIKFKSNKGRTIKNRMPWPPGAGVDPREELLPVEPSLYINYRRISLWNRRGGERLTLDFDLYFRRPQEQNMVRLENVFIAELKRAGKVYGSPFVRTAKDYGYTPQSLSKYCLGMCLTDSGRLKQNRFKPLLRKLGRLNSTGGLSA